jgi:hypothetical protein
MLFVLKMPTFAEAWQLLARLADIRQPVLLGLARLADIRHRPFLKKM